jgi:branched-subunit amino acid transport protein
VSTWLVILAVGAGSFAFRLVPLLVLQRATLSERTDRVIRHAGTAAIAALIALSTRQAAQQGTMVPAMLAVGAGVVLAARRASMLQIIVVGGALYAAGVIVLTLVAR